MANAKELREQADAAELEAAQQRRAAKEADRAQRKEEAAGRIRASIGMLKDVAKQCDAAADRLARIGGCGTEWATTVKLGTSAVMLVERLEERLRDGRFYVYDER